MDIWLCLSAVHELTFKCANVTSCNDCSHLSLPFYTNRFFPRRTSFPKISKSNATGTEGRRHQRQKPRSKVNPGPGTMEPSSLSSPEPCQGCNLCAGPRADAHHPLALSFSWHYKLLHFQLWPRILHTSDSPATPKNQQKHLAKKWHIHLREVVPKTVAAESSVSLYKSVEACAHFS